MTPESVVNKFIERCGPLDPKPQHHFIQDATNGRFGLATELDKIIWKKKPLKDYPFKILPAQKILPNIHLEADGKTFDWDERDLLKAFRLLQNAPFSKVSVIQTEEPCPIAIFRSDVPIYVLLAPIVLEIKGMSYPSTFAFKKNMWREEKPEFRWIQQMPNSTFWLVEFPTIKGSWVAEVHGYPIGRMLKCRNCKTEVQINDWVKAYTERNHPECMCSCDTYDDFCGCQRNRERAKFDRLWRQQTIRKRFVKRSMM